MEEVSFWKMQTKTQTSTKFHTRIWWLNWKPFKHFFIINMCIWEDIIFPFFVTWKILQICSGPLVSQIRRENRAKNKFISRHEHLATFKKKNKNACDSKLDFHGEFPQLHNSWLNSFENFSLDKTWIAYLLNNAFELLKYMVWQIFSVHSPWGRGNHGLRSAPTETSRSFALDFNGRKRRFHVFKEGRVSKWTPHNTQMY